jgi:DNA-binding FadR family transcriptional regulator
MRHARDMALERIAKRTLSDAVFEQLSREIVHGRMAPGVTLPPERELCETLGVNRGALREALRRLAQAGLVAIAQGGATRVLDYRKSAGLDLLSQLLFLSDGTVDLDTARSLMEIRAALAPDIARLCAQRRDDAVVQELRELLRRLQQASDADDLDALQDLTLQFWDVLVGGSQNIAYELAFNTLRTTYDKIRVALVHVMADENRDVLRMRALVDAVARRDENGARKAAAALVEHGTAAVLELLETLRAAEKRRADEEGAKS